MTKGGEDVCCMLNLCCAYPCYLIIDWIIFAYSVWLFWLADISNWSKLEIYWTVCRFTYTLIYLVLYFEMLWHICDMLIVQLYMCSNTYLECNFWHILLVSWHEYTDMSKVKCMNGVWNFKVLHDCVSLKMPFLVSFFRERRRIGWRRHSKVAFGTLSIKIASNVDYHLKRLPPFKLLVMLNVVFGIHK